MYHVTNRGRVRLIRTVDQFVLGAISISSLYRRFIVAFPGPWIVDISSIYRRYLSYMVHFSFITISHGECSGARQAHALKGAMHNAVCTRSSMSLIRCSIAVRCATILHGHARALGVLEGSFPSQNDGSRALIDLP